MRFDSGFDRANLSTFGLVLPASKYQDQPRRVAFFNDLTNRLKATPGVQAAAAMAGPAAVPSGQRERHAVRELPACAGRSAGERRLLPVVDGRLHDGDEDSGVEGRSFGAQDGATTNPVVLVNETLAKLYWPKESALGHRIRTCCGDQIPWATIVGVVKDVKQGGIDQKTGTEIYFLYDQTVALFGGAPRNMNIVVRSTLPLESLGARGARDA